MWGASCDRQQMTVPYWSQHQPVPTMPAGREAMIDVLQAGAGAWGVMIRASDRSN